MKLEDYTPGLEAEIGMIVNTDLCCPGVYHIKVERKGRPLLREYYVVQDDAPFAAQVQDYGQKLDGLRLYEADKPGSGWEVVQYEVCKYQAAVGRPLPEWIFRDMSLRAMGAYPEYFGTFPVPFLTPDGYTLRCRTLANGIYWLETSTYRELLAVCFPVWDAELSAASTMLSMAAKWDAAFGIHRNMDYIFFKKELSCIPIYELMETRQDWDGTVIHVPALMNALWEFAPEYAMHRNGGRRVIGMYPDAGTDFLLLK